VKNTKGYLHNYTIICHWLKQNCGYSVRIEKKN